jgi:hypothetical protein
MGDEQNQERDKPQKKRRTKLRDLTASKDAHVIGGASDRPQAKLHDLTASKDIHIIREPEKSGGQEES